MTTRVQPAGGLACFLRQSLWERTTGDKYVYDVEVVHYGLLSLLLERSAGFATRLLASPSAVSRVVQVDLFDLEVRVPDAVYFIEVKTWQALKPELIDRQATLLEQRSAQAIYLLTPFQTCEWTPDGIRQRSRGRGRLVEFQHVATMLRETAPNLPASLKEVAESYAEAIDLLHARTAAAV
jgi:hypothetical protein